MMEYFNSVNNNCDSQGDHNWPGDYGFFICVKTVLLTNMTQVNSYLDCLNRAEGVLLASIQPPAGELILGSYNYLALLLTGVAILSESMLGQLHKQYVPVKSLTLCWSGKSYLRHWWGSLGSSCSPCELNVQQRQKHSPHQADWDYAH